MTTVQKIIPIANSIVTYTFSLQDQTETDRFGKLLADVIPPYSTICLTGTLGAGKTRLVQAYARALGVPANEVLSPTFVICHEYQGARGKIYHFDAYRIADDDEFLNLGVEEYFDSEGVCFVEWGERVANCLPPFALQVTMNVTGENSRQVLIESQSPEQDIWLEKIESCWNEARR
ncbi:MAG: tRNA (adenosine(37)-N6)-threonylcarbamoyltransferase complex ATPase subunit type 1 TsaE [Planctomycetales bacterium]|nr:tRNA (adenosine(37)-N6)-threonylcarbamoyltransferase complex ATPase subunit type 1 TsaE [Planctomycetales bacterium]